MAMLSKWGTRVRQVLVPNLRGKRPGRQRGQSLVLLAFAMIGLLALAGLAVDLGMLYVQRVLVSRAADAAALAGVADLPMEEAAHTRALTYLQDHGYDYTHSDVLWDADTFALTGDGGVYTWDPPTPEDVTTVIWVDTEYSRDPAAGSPENSASRIRIRVKRLVPMTFMQFLGFDRLPAEATAEAENINRIDSVLAYDDSASMEFMTVCYGCWERDPDKLYPDGTIYPLHWSDTYTSTPAYHCAHSCVVTPTAYSDYDQNPAYESNDCHYREKDVGNPDYYLVIEAEEYSRIHPEYQPLVGEPFHTFWVIQHNGRGSYYHRDYPDTSGGDSYRGAYIRHHPFGSRTNHFDGIALPCEDEAVRDDGVCVWEVPDWLDMPQEERTYINDILPQPVPRADYDFEVPDTGTYFFWVRGQGGDDDTNDHLFWGVDGAYGGREEPFPDQGNLWEGADPDDWQWRCLNEGAGEWLAQGTQHTLNLWAGGPGFSVDRILITTEDPGSGLPDPAGFHANKGRTDWACNPCDPRFAGRPGGGYGDEHGYYPQCHIDNTLDPIYDDEQPIRDALEAAKYFVGRLDIRLDQIGYVGYDSSAEVRDELRCIRDLGPENTDGNPDCTLGACTPSSDPFDTACDPDCGCYQGVITNTVLYHLDTAVANGGTNIPEAIQLSIEVLSTSEPHFGRPGAAHVVILMTDGETHNYPSSCVQPERVDDLWPYNTGDESVDIAKDCSIYYANEARDNGVAIYAIGLGAGADKDLLREIAAVTGGTYYPASRDNLNDVFDNLYERIFIRLVK